MLTMYAKKVYHNMGFDVMLYRDREMTKPACQYQWHNSQKPDYRNKYVMFNCNRYRLEWL